MLLKFKEDLDKKSEVYLRVKIKPSVNKIGVDSVMEDETIKISLKSKPIKGMANKELIKFLAKEFEILEKNVRIISGAKERLKLIKLKK